MEEEEEEMKRPDAERQSLLTSGKYSIQEEDQEPDVEEDTQLHYLWEVRRLEPGKSSAFGAIFIVINAALGAGLLAFPYAFYAAGGVAAGIGIELGLVVFVVIGLLVLAYCVEETQKGTYEDVMLGVLGPYAKAIAEFCVAIYCFGTTITFLVVIGDQIDDITSAFDYHRKPLVNNWWVNRKLTTTIATLIFILPWMFFKRIGVLSYTSFPAVLCCLYITVVVTAKHFTIDDVGNYTASCDRNTEAPSLLNWTDAFNALPVICFGFQCHVSSVPIYAGLKQRSLKAYSGIIAVGIGICIAVYSLTGVFGSITFRAHSRINSDILRNYCPRDIPIDVARGTLTFVIITSYPILAFCGRTALDSMLMKLFRLCKVDSMVGPHETARLRVEGIVWVLLSLALALFVPEIHYVINPLGGLAGAFILIFPGSCLLKLTLASRQLRAKRFLLVALSCVMIVFGMFILGDSMTHAILEDVGQIPST